VRVAYLTNQYPAASHSFIRREIEALEAEGIAVSRFSIRPANRSQLPDPRDQEELSKTTCLLQGNRLHLVLSALLAVFSNPLCALKAVRAAFAGCEFRSIDVIRRLAYFAEAAALSRRLCSEKINHIHAHFGTNPATVARVASLLSEIPYSFTLHGPDEFDAPRQLDIAGKVRDSAFCVAISSYGKSQVMRWSAVADWGKIRVVKCGVDESFIHLPDVTDAPVAAKLCAVARLSPQKGIPLLLEAAAELRRRGRDFHLTLVGDGELRKDLENIIDAEGLGEFVELAGWANSSAVIGHLLAARVMVLPSFAEGLPVVIMEALALRRPVIVTSIAGPPELVDAQCGWLIPAGSVEKLVSALEEALDATPEQLNQMGESGRERVLKLHHSRDNGRKLAAIFRSGGLLAE